MNFRLAALVAASFALAPCVYAANSARPGFTADATPPQANPLPMAAPAALAANSLNEGFDNISTLTGGGWVMLNNSTPGGLQPNWFQGNASVFNAYDGATNSYIAANYQFTSGTGTINAWLLTPQLDFGAGATLTFYTRKPAGIDYPDRLEIRYSTAGASTNVGSSPGTTGDFGTVALSINPDLATGVYPTAWTQYTFSNLPHAGSGRIAFRYYVTGGGPNGTNSDYIGIDRVTYTTGAPEYQIKGSVSGVAGSGLVLQLNGANDLAVNADGSFTFSPYITQGGNYTVTVATQPGNPSQTCSVTNGSGTTSSSMAPVQVTCTTNAFTVGGNVAGLAGSGLTLQVNGTQDLPVNTNGSFAFPAPLTDGTAYVVTVLTQPTNPNQTCGVTNDTGTLAGASVTNVQVTCTTKTYFIGGSVSGLSGAGLILHLDSGQDVPITANGSFMFANPIPDGSAYTVSIGTPPSNPNQSCTISGASGALAGADVTTVQVSCTTLTHTVGGNVVGLNGSGLVLQLNGGNNLPVPADGAFTFSQTIQEGAAYAVTILSQPSGGASHLCVVANGSGTMHTQAVSDITVACDVIFIDGFEMP